MRRAALLLLSALFLLPAGCAPREETPSMDGFAPAPEERLTVYTSHKEEVYGPIVKEFEERTGIWVEVVTAGSNELLEQIRSEADGPQCDVMFGGGAESLQRFEDCFEPYACAESDQLKPGLRREGDPWTPFSALPVVLIYNTRLVSPGELTGWEDLLSSQWKGRIAFADPAVSGSSYTAAVTLMFALPGDPWDNLERLEAALDGNILSDSGDVVAAVDSGRCPVGVTLEETALKNLAQGANIAIVYPVEGTSSLPDGTALIKGAPHPDNAKAFLEFVQSADVQALVVSDFARRSVRTDVADREDLPDTEAFPIIDYDVTWAAEHKEDFLDRWAESLGEVSP